MEESKSKAEQQQNFHNSVAEIDSNTYIEGTSVPDELVKILNRILEGNTNQKDIILLRQYLVTTKNQNQIQLAKYIINAAEVGKLHNGDIINNYHVIDEETKAILRQLQQIIQKIYIETSSEQNGLVSISSTFTPQTTSEKFLVTTNSQRQISPPVPERNSFEFEVVTVDYQGRETKRDCKQAEYFLEDLGNGVVLEMVSIPGGNFTMGASREEEGSQEDERPQRLVNIKPFFMGRYPVTKGQWRAIANLPKIERFLDPDSSYFKGDNLPVDCISWYEAQEFCARISQKTGRIYRLPSEAEWEYACRGNMTYPFYFGSKITRSLANFCEEQKTNVVHRSQTTEVGTFPPNSFGLYDMHGNIWEWCADYQHGDYQDAPSDGSVWEIDGNPEYRMLRGGSWDYDCSYCRSASRYFENPSTRNRSFGFRVVCCN